MTTFQDIYNNYDIIYHSISDLKTLLMLKLINCDLEPNANMSFEELIHMVNDIESVICYIDGNVKPTYDIYNEISTNTNLTQYNLDVFKRINHYIKWLRYYLYLKGVDPIILEQTCSLKGHILLIDKIRRIRHSILNAIPINNDIYVGVNNAISIDLIDEDGKKITDGYIIIEEDGEFLKRTKVDDIIYITPSDIGDHEYTLYFEGTEQFIQSNDVTFILNVQPSIIQLNVLMSNINEDSKYYESDNTGYINDEWNISLLTLTPNGMPIPFIDVEITIGINSQVISVQTDKKGRYYTEGIYINQYNSQNNNNPISVHFSTQPINNKFESSSLDYLINVYHYPFVFEPIEDYTGKSSYQFTMTTVDEESGQPNHILDNYTFSVVFIDTTEQVTVDNSRGMLTYNKNIPVGSYVMKWKPLHYLQTTIKIKSNFVYSDQSFFYLNDLPQIQYTPNGNIGSNKTLDLTINNISYNNANNANFITSSLEQNGLITNNNGYIILPNELCQPGVYDISITANDIVNETLRYQYEIREPYEINESEYVRQSHIKYFIKIYDYEDFDINNISNHVQIKEKNIPLNYLYEYDENLHTLIITASISNDSRLKGVNTLNVNINNYITTLEFKLYTTIYEILHPEDFVLGNITTDIACYEANINNITITNNYINLSGDSNEEIFTVNGNITKPGTHTITICGTNNNNESICETHTVTVPKKDLQVQYFGYGWENQSISTTTNKYIRIGFKNAPLETFINVTFYYDNPANIMASKTISTSTSSETFSDLKVNQLPLGQHTIYASFDGNNEYYNSFLIQKDVYILTPTHIIHKNNIPEVDIGFFYRIYLNTLDNRDNIIYDGSYNIQNTNGITSVNNPYGVNDNIDILPNTLGNKTLHIDYSGTDVYETSSIDINFNVVEHVYTYYVDVTYGNNNNNGTSYGTAYKSISKALTSINNNMWDNSGTIENYILGNNVEDIGLINGSHPVNKISKSSNIFGHYNAQINDIQLVVKQLAPYTSLIVGHLMFSVDGNEYIPIDEPIAFINNSNQTINLTISSED